VSEQEVPAPSSDVVRPGEGMTPAEAYQLVAPRYGEDGAVLPDHFQQAVAKQPPRKRAVAKQPPRKRAAATRRAKPDADAPPTRPPDADSYDGTGDQEAQDPGEG
jgi:hypothetical protein